MAKVAEQLLAQVMTLDEADRIELAERAWGATGPSTDPEYVAAWVAEIKERIDRHDRGEVEMIPWEKVREGLLLDEDGRGA